MRRKSYRTSETRNDSSFFCVLYVSFHNRLENIELCACATGTQCNAIGIAWNLSSRCYCISRNQMQTEHLLNWKQMNEMIFNQSQKSFSQNQHTPTVCVRANFDSKHLTVYIDFEWVFFSLLAFFFALSIWTHAEHIKNVHMHTHVCDVSRLRMNEKKRESLGKHTEVEPCQSAVFFLYAHLSFACYECLTWPIIAIAYFCCAFFFLFLKSFECTNEKDDQKIDCCARLGCNSDLLGENNYKLTIYQRRHQHTQMDHQRMNDRFWCCIQNLNSGNRNERTTFSKIQFGFSFRFETR